MKKLLQTLMIFLSCFLPVYLVLIMVWGIVMPLYLRKNLNYRLGAYGHMHSRMTDVKNAKNIEVLILGSSHAYRGFDTRIFEEHGVKSFNLGSSSQTPVQTLMLLEKYLDRLNPKLVLFEVYPEIFSLDGVEASIDVVSNDEIDFHTIKMVLAINHIKTYNSFLYSWYRQLFGLDRGFLQPESEGDDFYVKGNGFVTRKVEYFKNTAHQPSSWNFNPEQLKAFDDIIKLLKKNRINYILVQAPLTKSLYNSKVNNHEADSFFNSKGRHINFNTEISLDDSLHFYDADHLNQYGVELFNEALLIRLQDEKLMDN